MVKLLRGLKERYTYVKFTGSFNVLEEGEAKDRLFFGAFSEYYEELPSAEWRRYRY